MTKPNADSTLINTEIKPSAFIDDGFTITGIIEERRNLSPEVELTYRPLGGMEQEAKARELDKYKPFTEDRRKARAKVVLERIERWSLPRPLTLENVLLLGPLFDIFESLIYNAMGPDRLLRNSERRIVEEVSADLKN